MLHAGAVVALLTNGLNQKAWMWNSRTPRSPDLQSVLGFLALTVLECLALTLSRNPGLFWEHLKILF